MELCEIPKSNRKYSEDPLVSPLEWHKSLCLNTHYGKEYMDNYLDVECEPQEYKVIKRCGHQESCSLI